MSASVLRLPERTLLGEAITFSQIKKKSTQRLLEVSRKNGFVFYIDYKKRVCACNPKYCEVEEQ